MRGLPLGARLSLTCVIAVILGGYAASGLYMKGHHKVRVPERAPDQPVAEEPFTYDDVVGVYHGIQSPSPLRSAIEAGHPGEIAGQTALDEFATGELTRWLADSDQVVGNWDNLDFGEVPPADLLDESCNVCHSRGAAANLKAEPFLEFADDIRAVAFDREIDRTGDTGLLASTHAHSPRAGDDHPPRTPAALCDPLAERPQGPPSPGGFGGPSGGPGRLVAGTRGRRLRGPDRGRRNSPCGRNLSRTGPGFAGPLAAVTSCYAGVTRLPPSVIPPPIGPCRAPVPYGTGIVE